MAHLIHVETSAFDPSVQIATLLTVGSRNSKTGDIATAWRMRLDMSPRQAQQCGSDTAVCPEECPLRPIASKVARHVAGSRPCYVKTWQAPSAVYRGKLDTSDPDLRGMMIRLDGYGDPAAAPKGTRKLLTMTDRRSAYTHAWRRDSAQWLRPYAMASVEDHDSAWRAWDMGWRTARVSGDGVPMPRLEVACPAQTRPGITCLDCGLCCGAERQARSVVLKAH